MIRRFKVPVLRYCRSALTESMRQFYRDAGPLDAAVVCAGNPPFTDLTPLTGEEFIKIETGQTLDSLPSELNLVSNFYYSQKGTHYLYF